MKNILSIVALTLILSSFTDAQARADADYYLMWPGKWFRVENGKVSKQPKFVVEQGLNRLGVRTMPLADEALVELYYHIFNPGDISGNAPDR